MQDFRTKAIALIIVVLPAGLIVLQQDTGTSLVFIAFLLVAYREGLSGNILLIGLLASVLAIFSLLAKETEIPIIFTDFFVSGLTVMVVILVGLGMLVFFLIRRFSYPRLRRRANTFLIAGVLGSVAFIYSTNIAFDRVLNDHQKTRVNILLGLDEDPQGAGYNVKQSKTAIGSGGFWGKGYLNGTLTKYKYVPMQSTDFIFCTIGEEWGFIGSIVVILLFLALLVRIIMLAERQRSNFTRIFGYCVACILFFHFAINVGMAIGLAPVIGIPLPFFSYGGSSAMAFTLLLFILIKLDAERLDILR